MRLQEAVKSRGKIAMETLLFIVLSSIIPLVSLSAEQADATTSLTKTKSMAEVQHEIVVILIKKKEYQKAVTEADKIFEMKWPDDQEPLLVRELCNLTDRFLRSGQAPLGLKLIEKNFGRFKKPSSQVSLLKEMGYLHKTMNQSDEALDCFRRARDLEGGD
jgi:tetratricopeptide (TPR) repeat protein